MKTSMEAKCIKLEGPDMSHLKWPERESNYLEPVQAIINYCFQYPFQPSTVINHHERMMIVSSSVLKVCFLFGEGTTHHNGTPRNQRSPAARRTPPPQAGSMACGHVMGGWPWDARFRHRSAGAACHLCQRTSRGRLVQSCFILGTQL